ncbi:GPR/FUN34 family protein [Penicillium argentinense]|uniref:GPR/FUN34 family protein n=1 Tax=Penicillium argentinense TaxID=1131581 RepID=A0A9W9KLG2_9EURO|nr:GPR/FUN34 family protein [Penicillium argentinense]KAJ5110640.1 GPR/FUN34 family protein [Penicillium argentinense]
MSGPTDEINQFETDDTNATSSTDSHQNLDYGPPAHVDPASTRYGSFAGQLQPGLYRPGPVEQRKIGNPAPLGLCGFALTTFVLGCINMQVRGITEPNIFVSAAYAYGGLVQLLSGMWEMAVGNTFGATALSSYDGFWIAMGITFTPGGFDIQGQLEKADGGYAGTFYDSLGLFLMGWFTFTFLTFLCTLKSTEPNENVLKAGGLFAPLAAFLAWWAALAGIADTSNSFFIILVWHFPWSPKGKADRNKE